MSLQLNKILLVEDEESLARLISLQLKSYGYDVDMAFDGLTALKKIFTTEYSTILLDRMMPNGNGLEVLAQIRSQGIKTPVIFVTALNTPDHIIEGLEAGADDYVTKPFDERVLVSRIRSVNRRAVAEQVDFKNDQDWLSVENISINIKAFEAKVAGERMVLTRSEFLLLQALMQQQGCVLTRKFLISTVQGEDVNVTGRTVDTHIFGLRKKLGQSSDLIETIRGVGYRMKFYE
jgi:two-component system, OmpR family, phosphate regulon response regulator PhoB